MASETVSSSINWNALASTKAYGDTVTIDNGAVLTLDQSVDAQGISDAAVGVNITCIAGFSTFEIANNSASLAIQFAGPESGALRVEAGSTFRVRGAKIILQDGGSAWESDGTDSQVIPGSAWTALYAAANEPGVILVETGNGTGVYEPWINIGAMSLSSFGANQLGKVFSYNTSTGAISFGDGGLAQAGRGGAIPPNGARVQVYNIGIGKVVSGGAWGIHATQGTNYELDANPGGIFDAQCCYLFGFYPNAQSAAALLAQDVAAVVRYNVTDSKTVNLTDSYACINRYASDYGAFLRFNETLTLIRGIYATENAAEAVLFEYAKSGYTNGTRFLVGGRNSANDLAFRVYRSPEFRAENPIAVGGRVVVEESPLVVIKDLVHSDSPRGVAFGSLYGVTVEFSAASSAGGVLDGMTLHAEGVVAASAGACFSNIGTIKNINYPQASTFVYASGFGSFLHNNNFGNPSSRFASHGSSDVDMVVQNSHCDTIPNYFNSGIVPSRSIFKGVDNSTIPTNLSGCGGTHFYEWRRQISPEAGWMGIFFTPKSAGSSAYTSNSGVSFALNGRLYLLESGSEITYEWPHYVKGVTAFPSGGTLTKAGQNPNNFTIEYDIDLGSGFSSSWTTLSMANLAAHTIDPARGFRMRIRITRGSANASDYLNQLTWDTTTNYTTYKYPAKLVTVVLRNMVAGSIYGLYRGSVSLANQIALGTAPGGDVTLTGIAYTTDEQINVRVRRSGTGFDPDYLEFNQTATLTENGADIFVSQVEDLVAE